MRVSCVFFHTHVNLGGSIGRQDSLDLRSAQSKVKHFIDAMDYDPATGEVVVHTNIRCGLTQGKAGRLRIPGSNVACAIEDLSPAPKVKLTPQNKVEA